MWKDYSSKKPLQTFYLETFHRRHLFSVDHNNFVQFVNKLKFYPAIKFTCEMSSERIVFLDTKVFKGSRFVNGNLRDIKAHFKPTETFQYTHLYSCHPLSVKNGFSKGETLRLLRELTQSKKPSSHLNEIFNPVFSTEAIHVAEVNSQQGKKLSLQTKSRTSSNRSLPLVTAYTARLHRIFKRFL